MAAVVVVLVLAALQMAWGHSYHQGPCPYVQPMSDFDMSKFQGRWYVLQKTSTSVRCLVNEYSPGKLQQTMMLGIPAINHVVRYQGQLTVPDPSEPANMEVKFPLNIAGRSSYIVFDTDYENYAGIYTCQKVLLWHRHSASIMSRNRTLDPTIAQQLHRRLRSLGVNPHDLDSIKQSCDAFPEDGIEVNIRPNVVKPTNVTEIIATTRDVINQASDVAKDVYAVYNTFNQVTGQRRRRDTELEEKELMLDWLP